MDIYLSILFKSFKSEVQTCGSPALRVVQLDSHILDNEIYSYFEKQLDVLISNLPISISIYYQKYIDEFKLALSSIFWLYRIRKGYSIGQEMMDIAYRVYPKRIIFMHYFISIILPYIATKITDKINDQDKKEKFKKFIGFLKLLEFVHHINYLRVGGYSSIFERILKLKTEYISPPTLGNIPSQSITI